MNLNRIFASPWFLRAVLGGVFIVTVLFLICAKKPWQFEEIDKIQDYGTFYSWWAAAINLLPLAILLFTADRWSRPLHLPAPSAPPALPKGFFLVVGAAMLVFALLAGMRLPTSLWDDEEYALRRAILGTYRVNDDGSAKLKKLPWSHTLWYYTKPTNHVFQSVLSRLSLSTWRAVARPKGLPLSEPAVRLPSYLGGILAVGTISLLLAHAGFAWEGALAAWILALHPWFLRLAPEARGYGMVFFLLPLSCLLAMRALDDGRWRWWILLALAEFALLYTWPPALMTLLVLNACLVLRVLTDDRLRALRHIFVSRWLVSGVAAGMLLFQLILPCIPQFREYMKGSQNFLVVAYWLKNVGSLLFTGVLWSKTGSLTPPYPETWPLAAAQPVLFGIAAGLAAALIAFGAVRVWQKGARGRCLVAVFLLPGPLMVVLAVIQHTFLFEWYVAFVLPGLAALAGTGVLGLAVPFSKKPWLPWTLAVATLAVFAFLTAQGRQFLLKGPAQPFRESVLLTRPTLDPGDSRNKAILTVSTVASPDVYDPLVHRATSLEDYQKLMEEADRRSVPLFANNGFPLALKVKYPEIAAMLADQNLFEPVAHLYAIEEMLDRTVVRYRPGSVAQAAWERYRHAIAPKKPDSVPLYY